MKKILTVVLALLIVAGALWSGITYWFGIQAEERYHEVLKQSPKSPYLKLIDQSYTRGFFASEAHTTIEILSPDVKNESNAQKSGESTTLAFIAVHDIKHGPFPFRRASDGEWQWKLALAAIDTRISLSHELEKRLGAVSAPSPGIPEATVHMILYAGGDGKASFSFPAFHQTFTGEETITIDWKGVASNLLFSKDFKDFKGSLKSPGFEVTGTEGDLKISGIESVLDLQESTSGIYVGDTSLTIGSVEFSGKATDKGGDSTEKAASFSVYKTGIKATSRNTHEDIDCSLSLDVDRVGVGDTSHGPGSFTMELHRLDATALGRLKQAVQEEQAQAPQRSQEELAKAMLATYMEILPILAKRSPEIEISRFNVKTSEGNFDGKAKIGFDALPAVSLENPLLLLSALKAHVQFTITEHLLDEIVASLSKNNLSKSVKNGESAPLTDEQITTLAQAGSSAELEKLVAQNLLVRENGSYKTDASYSQGRITVNGKRIQPQKLLQ